MNVAASTSSATILVAESLPDLRSLLVLILKRDGYQTLEAVTGAEALQIAAAHPGSIPLLVTGVNLPDMSGEKLGWRLSDHRPGIRTLCLSAYPREHLISAGLLNPLTPFLSKPFKLAELLSKAHELVTAAASTGEAVRDQSA